MAIMSSFRVKNYFKGSFKLTVSILMNIVAIFLQHLFEICLILSSEIYKQTNTTQERIQNHASQEGRCFHVSGIFKGSNTKAQSVSE